MKISFIGSGAWATALANVASDNGHKTFIYGIMKDEVEDININHRNSKYFNNVNLNSCIHATLDIEEAVKDADMIVLAVPSNQITNVLEKIQLYINSNPIMINVAKGFDPVTHQRLSVVIKNNIKSKIKGVVSLIGPSHAEEVVIRLYTAICSVSKDEKVAEIVQKAFSNYYLRIYVNTDEIGSEYGAAAKNVIALAVGIIEGLGFGDNTRAALMTRGLAEIARFGIFMGGEEKTYLGLTGLGDLIVTCSSLHSRNFQAGLQIGKYNNAEKFLKENTKTVEGILACEILYAEAKKNNIEMPIVNAVYNVIFKASSPKEELNQLMNRTLKSE